jgi:ribosomal protein L37AE/L43A
MSPTDKEKRIYKRFARTKAKDYSAYVCQKCSDRKGWNVELRIKAQCHFCKKCGMMIGDSPRIER